MFRLTGQRSARPLVSAVIVALAVGVLPLTTLLLHPPERSSATSILEQAPPTSPDSAPVEDPAPGSAWTFPVELPVLWPPQTEQRRAHSSPLLRSGHLRRIDRPPMA